MKINVCYVYWILLLVTFVSSSFFFVLIVCEDQPEGLQVVGNSTITHSTSATVDNAVQEELNNIISPSNLAHNEETTTEPLHSTGTRSDHYESAAAVHSSFADADAKPNRPSNIFSQSPTDVNVSPEIGTEFNNGLTNLGQALVLTMLESATMELQKQRHTDDLSSSLNKGLGSESTPENLTVETPPSPANQVPALQEAPDRENRSKEEPEEDSYIAQAEPKVLEVRYNVVDIEELIPLPNPNKKVIVVGDEAKEVEASDRDKLDDKESTPATPTPDEIPSFSEWAQKKMEEAEKNVLNGTSTGGPNPPRPASSSKLRSKNYASPDCGAKIAAHNPEAESANNVLSPSRDEYVLNACGSRIWLVIELCEAIQAKKIEVANFELFSNSPEDFSVSVSDRFPTRDWRSVGHFTARDLRDIQSYDLDPHLFGKFVKVELHSHYGNEHYCPISMIRVYGTSEFEVLETEVEAHASQELDEDDEEGTLETGDPSDPPRNLFGSARAVVMSIVKKAAEALVKGSDSANITSNTTDLEDVDSWTVSSHTCQWALTPRHMIVCDNCSNSLYHYIWELLGQKHRELYKFVQVPFVRDALMSGPVCVGYGLDFGRRRPLNYPSRPDPGDYLKSLLPDSYIAAMCNALAVLEKKVMLNTSCESNSTILANITHYNEVLLNTEYEGLLLPAVATCSVDTSLSSEPGKSPTISDKAPNLSTSSPHSGSSSTDNIASHIKPTKTFTEAEVNDRLFASTDLSDALPPKNLAPPEVDPIVESSVSSVEHNTTVDERNGVSTQETEEPSDSAETIMSEEDPALDTLLSDLKDLDPTLDITYSPVLSSTTTTLPPQKESVFVRITNRIKALERNMSLSSQYLEELSRRYKKQVEEISRTLNRTLAAAEMEAKRRDEIEKKSTEDLTLLREEIASLTLVVNTLLVDRDSWYNKAMVVCQHMVLVVVEVMFFVGALCLCRRLPVWDGGGEKGERKWSLTWGSKKGEERQEGKRRKSMEAVPRQCSPKARRKRPSEVALNIAGTYTDLLITEPQPARIEVVWTAPKAETKRRRRRKKEGGLPKSSSSASLQQKNSRKTSTNSSSGGGSGQSQSRAGDFRRASLSELGGSFWLPVDGSEGVWMRGEERHIKEDVAGAPTTQSMSDTLRLGSEPCIRDVAENIPTIDTLDDSLPEMNGVLGCENLPKYRSLSSVAPPPYMRTAAASRSQRRASETIAQSSQTSLVPTTQNASYKGSEVGTSQGRKKATGFKKMVKRFF